MTDVIHDAGASEATDTLRRCPVGTEIQTLVFEREMFTTAEAAGWARRHGFKAPTADVKLNTIRLRQKEPGDFVEGSFRTIPLRAGVKAVIGCPKSARDEAPVVHENPRPPSPDDPRASWRSVDWSREMARLREIKPRPLHKRYGKSPTPEQAALHKEEERVWNAKYRYASAMQKITLERDNAEFRATGKLSDHVHAVPAGTTGPEIPVAQDAKDAKECGCTPTVSVARDPAYNKCLEEAAKLGPIRNTEKVYALVRQHVETTDQEVLLVVPLDARYQLRGGVVEVHKGASASVQISTMHVLRAVTTTAATQFIVVHSHPSGKASPSRADLALTKHLEKATKATFGEEVLMLDHVVVGRRQFYSIREEKLYTVK